jgi:serine/threonine-protein kinase
MPVHPIRSGAVVARRYRATRRIASGAMGEVWEGVHVELGQRVAIKVLRKESHQCREMVVRFAREACLLARVQSENVVRVIDYVERGRHGPVLVMELLEGPSFAELVHAERVSVEDTVDVAIDVLRGLQAMHAARVIHRDVKPGNVVLRHTHDGKRRAVIIDLGVGRLAQADEDGTIEMLDGDKLTTADRVVGTLEYMAPEQITDCQSSTVSVDVYAVGALMYRAVAGAHPFGDKHGLDLVRVKIRRPTPPLHTGRVDRVARRFEQIVARALAFSAKDRYKADELLADLEQLRRAMQSPAPIELPSRHLRPLVPPPLPAIRARMTRRRKVAAGVFAAGAALVAACSSEHRGAHAAREAPAVVQHAADTRPAPMLVSAEAETVCK